MSNESFWDLVNRPHGIEAILKDAMDTHHSATQFAWLHKSHFTEFFTFAYQEASRRPADLFDRYGRPNRPVAEEYCERVMRFAAQSEQVFRALLNLTPEVRHRLMTTPQGPEKLALVREVLAAIPAGAEWIERRDAHYAAIEAAEANARKQRDAEFEAAQPPAILAAIEAAGTVLSLAKDCKSIQAVGPDISPEHLETLRKYKSEVIALLNTRAAAAVPRQVV